MFFTDIKSSEQKKNDPVSKEIYLNYRKIILKENPFNDTI